MPAEPENLERSFSEISVSRPEEKDQHLTDRRTDQDNVLWTENDKEDCCFVLSCN